MVIRAMDDATGPIVSLFTFEMFNVEGISNQLNVHYQELYMSYVTQSSNLPMMCTVTVTTSKLLVDFISPYCLLASR